ncbi:15543_t:CDS:2, partial [Entrophospora sp. SA101]
NNELVDAEECKFSYPQSITKESKSHVENKDSKTHNKYLPYLWTKRTCNSSQLNCPHFNTSNRAQLNMTEDD